MLLLSVCENGDILKIFRIAKIIINILKVLVPLLLIVSLSLEYIKYITGNKDDLSKVHHKAVNKIIAAVLVFLVPTLISISTSLIEYDNSDFIACFKNATEEGIKNAYIETSNNYMELLRNNPTINNYTKAKKAVLKIKDESITKPLESELEVIYKKIVAESSKTPNNNNPLLGIASDDYRSTFTATNGSTINYWTLVPNNATENMPLIVFLHGGGGNAKLSTINNEEMANAIKRQYGRDFPFILLMPHKSSGPWLTNFGGYFDSLSELVLKVIDHYKIDKDKVIITGASDGGLGAWQFPAYHPELFSAVVPVSGTRYGNGNIDNLINLPIKCITSVASYDSGFYYGSLNDCNYLTQKGGVCTVTKIDGLDHDTIVLGRNVNGTFIEGAYSKETIDWMLSQSK